MSMEMTFEKQKNIKAATYTAIICSALFILFFVLKWNQSSPPAQNPLPIYLEVNLGNSETGQGNTPSLSKEAPAPEVVVAKSVKATTANKSVKINTSSNDPSDEAVKTDKARKITKNLPIPAIVKPKALFGKYAGGNSKGGNAQDSYNEVKDQGVSSGKGDQGVAGGSINGKTYSGQGGPFVTKGDRKIIKAYSFNGDVEPATIYAEIEVNPAGVGRFTQIVKGSSSNDSKYKKAIVDYLTKISFNSSDHSSFVTVKFKFDVQ